MARLIRPLKQWPQLHPSHHHLWCGLPSGPVLSPDLPAAPEKVLRSLCSAASSTSRWSINRPSRGSKPLRALIPSVLQGEEEEQDGMSAECTERKSRNQKKREARRAVRWAMELASFNNSQIKRILRLASLEEDVFDALMLVKRLAPDVREGKRRQFNYIGKLLREVEPDLMDASIRATKDGDERTMHALAAAAKKSIDDDGVHDVVGINAEYEAESKAEYITVATRWFDGLISKDVEVTNEVYSLQAIDFDRQELRKLVRRVHSAKNRRSAASEETSEDMNTAVMEAEKSLTCFLRGLAKQMLTTYC